MVAKRSNSDVSAPNFTREPISDVDLIRGFLLALGAGGRKQKTLDIYEKASSPFPTSPGVSGYPDWPPWTAPTSATG